MAKRKLSTTQVRKLTRQMSNAMRKLTIDKMDNGSQSNVKMSLDRMVKFMNGVQINAMLKK